jgi:hypothetical protein
MEDITGIIFILYIIQTIIVAVGDNGRSLLFGNKILSNSQSKSNSFDYGCKGNILYRYRHTV